MRPESDQSNRQARERHALVQKVAGSQLAQMHEAFSNELGRRLEFVS